MNKRTLSMLALIGATLVVGCEEPTRPGIDERLASDRQVVAVPDRYVVVFNDDVDDPPGLARGMATAHGLVLRHTYSRALKGFAAVVPPGRVEALRDDPRVRYVTPDRVHELHQEAAPPTGVDRIEADLNPSTSAPVNVDVAILDTGIDLDHPDLNVVRWVSFAGGSGDDGYGHGTHVAGTVAALDNGAGVVGVAPGARLWAVKVCKNSGRCSLSDIIAGIDYVVQNAGEIAVANMSLGGPGSDDGNCGQDNEDPEHEAICRATDAGVVFVVSAGNSRADAANYVPASYDEVITVSALADFDGRPGGSGASTCRSDEDDSFASFSNHGADVDLMAPGVCIESTWKQGGTNTISGTSMAAPHVTGSVALYIATHERDANGDGSVDGGDVAFIRSEIVGSGIEQMDPCGLFHFDDPDDYAEPIVFANGEAVGGTGSCSAPAPAGGDIAIAGVVPGEATAAPGESIDVTVTVSNVGGTGVADDIFVTLVSDNTTLDVDDDIPIGSQTIPGGLAAGASTELVFPWTTLGASTGTHTLTARHGLTDGNPDNDSRTTSVTIEGATLPTVHVGNLERASTKGGGVWTAWVRITVHDANDAVVSGATVTGTWDNAGNTPTRTDACVTDASGRCQLSYEGIPNRDGNILFRVDGVELSIGGATYAYDQAANHDPDGNANDEVTTIRVFFSNSDDYLKAGT